MLPQVCAKSEYKYAILEQKCVSVVSCASLKKDLLLSLFVPEAQNIVHYPKISNNQYEELESLKFYIRRREILDTS